MASSLIIFHDPHEGMLQLYRAMLARSPYRGIFTADAGEAIYLCRNFPVTLLVSDFDSHYADDHCINVILDDPATAYLPVVLVTVFDHWRDSALAMGVAGVLRKPFTHSILFDTIHRSLTQRTYYAQAMH